MALIKCPECGKEISDKASACPNCGCPASAMNATGAISSDAEKYGIVVCRKCGYSIPSNHKYCDNCGELLDRNLNIIRDDSGEFDNISRQENQYLQDILGIGENVRAIARGTLNSNVGLLICTNLRILFLSKGYVYGGAHKEINLKSVTSIYQQNKLFFSAICIEAGTSRITILNVNKGIGQSFVRVVNELLYR